MSRHPDDGTIQMLLDDELDCGEREQVESHLAGCQVCAARVAEARAYLHEADRLVEVLQVPGSLTEAPAAPRRRRPGVTIRNLAWAASILLAVSLGYWGRGALAPAREAPLQEGERRSVAAAPTAAPQEIEAAGSTAAPAAQAAAALQRTEAPAATEQPLARREEAKQVAQPAAPAAANEASVEARADFASALSRGGRAAWQVVTMDEAVRTLGGQIRLIDGLAPERVELGPGTAVAGASASEPVVRVSYAAGAIVLDQQRLPAAGLRQEAALDAAAKAAPAIAPPSTNAGLLAPWREQAGIWFVVTGAVSADSLATLAGRVR